MRESDVIVAKKELHIVGKKAIIKFTENGKGDSTCAGTKGL
jgi:hypothetical protein